jgi:hypothetical protein
VVEGGAAGDDVEVRGGQRERRGVADAELEREAAACGLLAPKAQQLSGRIDAERLGARLCERQREEPRPAGDIEGAYARRGTGEAREPGWPAASRVWFIPA